MHAPLKKLFTMAAAGCFAFGSVALVVACSDDSGDDATPTGDAGGSETGNTNPDTTPTPDRCVDAGAPARTCTAAACTAQNGEPSVCVADQCVKLKSPECQTVGGAVEDDNALVMGLLIDRRGGDRLAGGYRLNSVELAVSEINAAGGIPTGDGCGSRPLAFVACDDSNVLNGDAGDTAETYNRRKAATHLATELKVIGIMGAQNSNNTVDIATNVTNPAKTLMIAPTAGAPEITSIANATQDGVRVLWRTVPSDALQGKAVAKYGEAVEKELARGTTKVAIVNRNDAFGHGLRDGVKANLIVNGKPYADPANAANILEVQYPIAGATAADYKAARDAMLAHQPDIIYFFGLGEIAANIVGAYESDNAGAAQKPMWISSSSGQRSDLINALKTNATGLKSRVRGTSAQVISSLSQDFFNFRYKAKYDEPATLTFGQTQSYDATYLIAFGAAASKPTYAPLASLDVAKGLAKTVGGTEVIGVGPAKLKAAFEKLRSGGTIDFNGASGPLDFDIAVGEAPGDYPVWCVRTDPNNGDPVYENVTGMTWRYATNSLDGTFTCPQ